MYAGIDAGGPHRGGFVTDPTPPPGPASPWPSDAPGQDGPWASDYREPLVEAPPRPRSIVTAMKLMYLGAGLQVVGAITTFLLQDTIRDSIADSDRTLTESELDSAMAGVLAVTVITSLIAIGLWVWMAYANGQGKSWARIVASVLGGLNIVFTVLNLAGGNVPALALLVSLFGVGLAGYILWLLWRPESTQYYVTMSGR
jgi:hypothetical protein